MRAIRARWLLAPIIATTLTACGGGGGGAAHVASTPPPPAPPPPPPPPNSILIKIFAVPTAGEYTTVGVSISGPGGNLDTYTSQTDRFGPISSDPADQAHIRYTTGGFYEAKLAGAAWDRLVPYLGIVNPHPDTNNYFQPASVPMNHGYVVTSNSRNNGYSYSELASWGSIAELRNGYAAFGVPTPAGGVPLSGSATFQGSVFGSTDIMVADNLYGGFVPLSTDGYVTLNFDFAAGSLDGKMDLFLPDGMNPAPLGSFAFQQTVFSAGSTTYSGSFVTSATGQNFFLGRFTGPNAEETIGSWAIPFNFNQGVYDVPADGQTHQAFGAWIAKRGN